jgi:hypothetical protein
MDDRARRIGENEALFREVNERINELDSTFGIERREFTIVCECGKVSCAEHINIAHAHYAELRSDPTWFAVLPGHELPSVETVVEKRSGYFVVQKDEGGPAELATELSARH